MNKKNTIQYIQGLRALSVVMVLLFHIDKNWLPSGYLGVDAFFAISGFVITRMIILQWRDDAFSLKGFYISRVNKLLPPLFLVLAITVLVFALIYPLSDKLNVFTSAVAALISLSNVFFFFDSGYFSEESIYKPLLHTWSLSVEEQFYLIWPFCLLFLLKKPNWGLPVTITIAMTSCVASALIVKEHFDIIFYLMPFRGYQLLFGAVLAMYALRHGASGVSTINLYRVVLVVIPLLIFLFSFVRLETSVSQFIFQCITSVLIAYACFVSHVYSLRRQSNKCHYSKSLIINSIESPISLYLGARSYHIYLVHWPVITAFSYLVSQYQDSSILKLIVFVTCVLLSELLYRLVAHKFHEKNRLLNYYVLLLLLSQ